MDRSPSLVTSEFENDVIDAIDPSSASSQGGGLSLGSGGQLVEAFGCAPRDFSTSTTDLVGVVDRSTDTMDFVHVGDNSTSTSGLVRRLDCSTDTVDLVQNVLGRATSTSDLVSAVAQTTATLDLTCDDGEMDIVSFVDGYSIEGDLEDVFNNLIDDRFPVSLIGDRRQSFEDYVRSFSGVFAHIRVVYPDGINWLMNISYFLLYNFLCMLNRHRGGFFDDDLIRRNVVLILNDCANGDFNLLFDLIFD